jgi:hypothetical protein
LQTSIITKVFIDSQKQRDSLRLLKVENIEKLKEKQIIYEEEAATKIII